MNAYLKRIWKTRKRYILSLALLVFIFAISWLMVISAVSAVSMGSVVGMILALILFLGPVIYVEVKGYKIAKPKPIFYEPKLWQILGIFALLDILWTALIVGILMIPGLDSAFSRTLDADGFMSGLIMIPIICGYILWPVLVYVVFIRTRYRRVVEYGSTEWNRRNK